MWEGVCGGSDTGGSTLKVFGVELGSCTRGTPAWWMLDKTAGGGGGEGNSRIRFLERGPLREKSSGRRVMVDSLRLHSTMSLGGFGECIETETKSSEGPFMHQPLFLRMLQGRAPGTR